MRFHRNTPRAMGLIAMFSSIMSCSAQDTKITPTVDEDESDDTGDDGGTPYDPDVDDDGHEHEASGGDDCVDSDPDINPDATELCDGLDNDCDDLTDEDDAADATTWYADADGDGFGSSADQVTACEQPSGYIAEGTDCVDADATIYPGATETAEDGIDQDCDGSDAVLTCGEIYASAGLPLYSAVGGELTFVVRFNVSEYECAAVSWGGTDACGTEWCASAVEITDGGSVAIFSVPSAADLFGVDSFDFDGTSMTWAGDTCVVTGGTIGTVEYKPELSFDYNSDGVADGYALVRE